MENSVSKYPKFEGRFLQVSGVKFQYDPNKEPMQRIVPNSLKVNGEDLDLERDYTIATTYYIGSGNEGYTALKEGVHIVDIENSITLKQIIKDLFGNLSHYLFIIKTWLMMKNISKNTIFLWKIESILLMI